MVFLRGFTLTISFVCFGLFFPPLSRLVADEPSARPLRLLSYNIHHGEGVDGNLDLPRIAKVILSARPDLVALQEVDVKTSRGNGVDQAAELARLTAMHVAFGKSISFGGGDYGNAILSRWPIVRSQLRPLPNPLNNEARTVLEAVVEPRSHLPAEVPKLMFWSTHLDHTADPVNRTSSVETINSWRETVTFPLLLAGDLNAVPESMELALFWEKWSNPAGRRIFPTIPVKVPIRQIDYVLACRRWEWKVLEITVLDEPIASDHRPILTVLKFMGKKE